MGPFLPVRDRLAERAASTALRRQTAKKSIESADARSLRSFAPAISMMKAAEPGTGDHRRGRRRLAFHWPSIRRVLIEGIVNPVAAMVVHVIANEPPQMLFVQSDDIVEISRRQLPTQRSAIPFFWVHREQHQVAHTW
jgi:hypothetical protein